MEDLEDYMSDPQSFLNHDEDDEFDEEFYDFADPSPENQTVLEESPNAPLPYNQWCHQVDSIVQNMTNWGESIETICDELTWWSWWKTGKTPDEAAEQGLKDTILLEDE